MVVFVKKDYAFVFVFRIVYGIRDVFACAVFDAHCNSYHFVTEFTVSFRISGNGKRKEQKNESDANLHLLLL